MSGAEAPQESNGDVEMSAEKLAQKEARAAAKKAANEAKKAKAAEKAKKLEAQKAAQAANAEKKAQEKAAKQAKAEQEAADVAAKVAAAEATPEGQKKDVSQEAPKSYHPKYVEAAWYEWWSQCGYFAPDVDSDKEPFVIVIPPPNVTGALHIGHALTNAIQDAVVRYHRMRGRNALWVPGTDHAGIATQTVVEKKLLREGGQTRHDLGREAFIKEVYKWVDDYGGRIWKQQKKMGISVDWSRQVFTLDANMSRAVLEAFVRFHDDGLIYRDNRLVNWCCKLRTAVSDIEVDHIEVEKAELLPVPGYDEPVEFGAIISFAYPIDGLDEEIVVATTRLETMLGDVAVAVHPDDERYKHLHGKYAVHPVMGRKLPIVQDAELVDMSFGTGAVKITPAHDPNDFKTGQRHNLPMINVFDDTGNVNANGGQFEGQPRFVARKTVAAFLEEKRLYRGKADNKMSLPICSRSKDVIEPLLKPQWWVDCSKMAAAAADAARSGTLEILPSDFEVVWYRWLDNIRDWCISRQLWWGHRIPAWYVLKASEDSAAAGVAGAPSEQSDRWVVARSEEEARTKAEARFPGEEVVLHQDEDVLDTWFSSGLFPFSVFSWPEQTAELDKFYPTALLETGHDILFFWVARMVMMGLQLTGQVPFKQVYLHAMVRDAHGRKMSKSLGNVINPLDVIAGISLQGLHDTLTAGNLDAKEMEKARAGQAADFPEGIEECGTDALRFALCAYTAQGRDINLDIKRVVAYRHWCNKLWNAIKFAMQYLGPPFAPAPHSAAAAAGAPFECRWILSRLTATAAAVNAGFEGYDFAATTQAIYAFWQYDVCDTFIELIKPTMRVCFFVKRGCAIAHMGTDAAAKDVAKQVLYTALEAGLRLLHPFMPFLTEELWQRLPRRESETAASIMVASYPTQAEFGADDAAAEAGMTRLQALVKEARALRASKGLKLKTAAALSVACTDSEARALYEEQCGAVATLVGDCPSCSLLPPGADPPAGTAVAVVDTSTTLYLHFQGAADPAAEKAKVEKQAAATEAKLSKLRERMAAPAYANAPAETRDKDAAKVAELTAEVENLRMTAAQLAGGA